MISQEKIKAATTAVLEHYGKLVLRAQGNTNDEAPTVCAVSIEFFNDGDYRIAFSGFAKRALMLGALEDCKYQFLSASAEHDAKEVIGAMVEAAFTDPSDFN